MTKIDLQFVNNSPTNLPQHKVIQKLASYFGLPIKMLRASLNQSKLLTNILSFEPLNDLIQEDFSVASYKIKLPELLNLNKWSNSKLLQVWEGRDTGTTLVIMNGSELLAMVPYEQLKSHEGVGFIYTGYEDGIVTMPLVDYLKIQYPPPLS